MEMLERISCHHAAAEVEENLGIMSHAPHVAEMLRELRSCTGEGCIGTPRFMIVQEAKGRLLRDIVLALRN